ncbi:hypothetical protein ACIQPR_14810 [Streptomyces sp. NPDC091280]|uniref:hypothetical protein n=1 Tax=Streptomyces sp. NPDC091280 TaxID=3365984 RepID=UPI00382A46E5
MTSESRRPGAEAVSAAVPRAEQAVEWLAARGEVEQTFRAALGGLPDERQERLARMADVLQATARGLGPRAAAVWAGVSEHLLHQWLANDADFAAAVRAASALAVAHAGGLGPSQNPATVRVVVVAMSGGVPFGEAADAAGLSTHRLRRLWRASPTLVALLEAARHVRSRRPKVYVPSSYRPRKPGRKRSAGSFRLVRRDDG